MTGDPSVFHTQLKFDQLYPVAVMPSDATGAQTWITALGCTVMRPEIPISLLLDSTWMTAWCWRDAVRISLFQILHYFPKYFSVSVVQLWAMVCLFNARSRAMDNYKKKKKKSTLCIARAVQGTSAGSNYLYTKVGFQKVPHLFFPSI